jgi:folate-binding protein YgfZ
MKTALTDRLAADGARLTTYAGAETAAEFQDPAKELAAITRGVGVYDLGWRAKVDVRGEDRMRWLNGMVTNNVRDLKPNHGNYNFVLNSQGRIQGDLYIYNRGDHMLLDTERSQVEKLLKLLEHYIIMDDVELSDASDQITSIGIQGPRADGLLEAVGLQPDCADPLVVCDLTWNGQEIAVTRMANQDYLTYELWLAPGTAIGLWDALVNAGATPTGTDALEKFRVLAGVPKYGQDIRERDLPQETGQQHALDFNKGCYLGQEIVERIRSRGNVHRAFTGFRLGSSVERGTKLILNDKELGELTSIAEIGNKTLGLGYIRREAGGPGSKVRAGATEATITQLPFKEDVHG